MHPLKTINERPFSQDLFEIMKSVNPGIEDLEPYEFSFALENLTPQGGWESIHLDPIEEIERKITDGKFFSSIQIKPTSENKVELDPLAAGMTRMLFAGLVSGNYPVPWVNRHFYFDIRGFYFLCRTQYFTPEVLNHLNHKPFRSFGRLQAEFDRKQEIGYRQFKEANRFVDQSFMEIILKLIKNQGVPALIGIAGPTAAGKTEIVSRLTEFFKAAGMSVTSLELDHFFLDRDYREEHGLDSLGIEGFHHQIFIDCLSHLKAGKSIQMPCYDFISGTSSHDLSGKLKQRRSPLCIEPGDIIFIEGNFPFLYPEIAQHINVKVVYLTDDDVRLKRKWRRDMDLRKKYDLNYYLNRYFREQYLMAEAVFIPQMEVCDLMVDTTGGCIWATRDLINELV